MTRADAALAAFTLFNTVRVLAYLPQIAKIAQDRQGAAAISITTWSMFAASHGSTVFYALFSANDPTLALVFSVNAACCGAIIALTLTKRGQFRRASAHPLTEPPDPEPPAPSPQPDPVRRPSAEVAV